MTKMTKFFEGGWIDYEILKLVDYYDPILRESTVPFDFDSRPAKDALSIAFTLVETMDKYGGLGLSANQVGLKDRVCVINMGKEAWTLFNPRIVKASLAPSQYQEGCLSYPGLYLKVHRSESITVQFQALNGQVVEQEFSGLTAVCIQHEIDHLDGVVYTDKVSPIKLDQAKRKVKKNLKKMKIEMSKFVPQEEQTIVTEKQKAKPILDSDSPVIKILDSETQEKEPEKFVYKVG